MAFGYLVVFFSKKILPPVIEQFLGPAILFILTPVIINKLGLETYGTWVLLLSISMFSQVLYLGVTAWIAKIIAEEKTKDDKNKIDKIISSNFLLIIICTLPASIIFSTLIYFNIVDNVSISFIFFCIISCLFQEIDNLFSNSTKGYELFHYALFMEFVGRFLWAITIFIGIFNNQLIMYTCFAIILKSAVKYISFSTFIRRDWILPKSSFQEMKNRINESKWMFFQLLGGTSLSLFDRLLIPIVLGINKLAVYTPCVQLAQLAFSVPSAANQILMPMFSRFKSSNNYPNNWVSKIILASIFSTLPCLILFIFSHDILSIWINNKFAEDNSHLLKILSAAYGLLSSLSTLHFLLLGIGKSKLVAKINLVAGLIMVIVTVIISQFGIIYIACTKFIYPAMQLSYLFMTKNFIRKI